MLFWRLKLLWLTNERPGNDDLMFTLVEWRPTETVLMSALALALLAP
jgi:hypothetical protein